MARVTHSTRAIIERAAAVYGATISQFAVQASVERAHEVLHSTERNYQSHMSLYIKGNALKGEERIFPICYSTARSLVKGLGDKLNIHVTPHDLW
jgi:hypothetical protein